MKGNAKRSERVCCCCRRRVCKLYSYSFFRLVFLDPGGFHRRTHRVTHRVFLIPHSPPHPPIMASPSTQSMDREVTRPQALEEIQVVPEPLIATLGCIACFPFVAPTSCWTLDVRTEALVLHFGQLTAHVKEPGCYYHNCCGREIRTLSMQTFSRDMPVAKITDSTGNPILVSAVLSYRFVDTKAALFNVSNLHEFVMTQAQAALKATVSRFTYDELKHEPDHFSADLDRTLSPKVAICGVHIESISLNELNYAPEVASSMLKKQSANALVEARHLIVKGSVDIAREAIAALTQGGMTMTDEERFKLVCGLLIVTAGDKEASPVLALT